MDASNTTKSAILVIVAASLWGTTGLVSKPMMDAGMTSIEVAASRLIITAVVSFLFLISMKREKLRIQAKDLWIFIIIGLSRVLSTVLLFFTQNETYLTLGIVLEMTAPCFVILFTLIFFRKSVSFMKYVSAVLIVIGCMMVAGIFTNLDKINIIGLTSGLLSGVCTAVFMLGSKAATDRGYDSETILFYCFFFASIIVIPFTNFELMANVVWYNPDFIAYMLMLGIVMTFFSYYLNFKGVKGLTAATVSILSTMELVVTIVIGWVFYDQVLTVVAGIGTLIVLFAISISEIDVKKVSEKIKEKRNKHNVSTKP